MAKNQPVVLQVRSVFASGEPVPVNSKVKFEIAYQAAFDATIFATVTIAPYPPGDFTLDKATLAKLHSSASAKDPEQNAIRAIIGGRPSNAVSVYVADSLKGGPYE